MWVGISTLIIYIIIGIMVVNKTRNQLQTITFKEAFTVFFITAVIGITLSTLFNIILFNLIDPASKETIQQLTIKYAAEMMQKFGAPAASINEAITKMEETDNFSIGSLIKGMFTSYLVNAVFGLLLAAIFKSRPTEHS
jgi:ABC-type antimicrobial peptide transport system permease subunit